ncbi:MAG TPA: helix-turn-helix domain-containing protein [Stellaceae bacterium]|jgi:DNA-binding IclR family transcriptional regulator|nr:helix-turn-helix domain-containing protein [Stellaceae bacterium]
MSDAPATPQTVRVVERAIDILHCFQGPQDSLTLQQIVERSGLQKATAFRIATTLAHAGILSQSGPGGAYMLGYLTLRMPNLIRSSNELRNTAWANLKEVGALINETVVLVIRDGDDMINVDKVDSLHLIDEMPVMGERRKLHLGAAGLAVLASLDAEAASAYWRGQDATPDAELEAISADAKQRGVLTLHPSAAPGRMRPYAQVAAPLITSAGRIVGALSVTIPENRLSAKLLARCELHLKASADAIGSRL